MLVNTVFVCTAALAILDRLDVVDEPMLAWWLAERQLPNGGLNGRPEKLEDVRPLLLTLALYVVLLMTCLSLRFVTAFGRSRHCQFLRNSNGLMQISSYPSSSRHRCINISYTMVIIQLMFVLCCRTLMQAGLPTVLGTWPTSSTHNLVLLGFRYSDTPDWST